MTCDETCEYSEDKIVFELNNETPHVIYGELEPDVYLPTFYDGRIQAFSLDLPNECLIGLDSFTTNVQNYGCATPVYLPES